MPTKWRILGGDADRSGSAPSLGRATPRSAILFQLVAGLKRRKGAPNISEKQVSLKNVVLPADDLGTNSPPPRFAPKDPIDMEHIAAILLIVGCSNNLADCSELPAPATMFAFEDAHDCQDALPVTLHQLAGTSPRVIARCVYVDPANDKADAVLTWTVDTDGALIASVDVPKAVVASAATPAAGRISLQQ